MNAEEKWKSIEILSELRAKYSCFDEKEEPYYRALSLAIQSIREQIIDSIPSAEPCEDAISRQAVDELVDELARAISDERCCMSRGRSTATIMQDILNLPSVKLQEPKLIPVSEKPPEESRVILQYETPKGYTDFVVSWINKWGRWQNIDGNFIPIAWMPLPKPYKPQKISYTVEQDLNEYKGNIEIIEKKY